MVIPIRLEFDSKRMARRSGYRYSGRRRRSSHGTVSVLVFGLLIFGLLALCAAAVLPFASLVSSSPTSMVTASSALDPATASHAAGLLLLALTAILLGVALAGAEALRPNRGAKH